MSNLRQTDTGLAIVHGPQRLLDDADIDHIVTAAGRTFRGGRINGQYRFAEGVDVERVVRWVVDQVESRARRR